MYKQCPYCAKTEAHVCSVAERTRESFMRLLNRLGDTELERKMRKRELYRNYYRRYPYDGKKPVIDIEELAPYLAGEAPSMQETMVMRQTTDEYLSRLTDLQRDVVEMTDEGYKPREIAEQQGRDNSGSIRWHKNAAKKKLIELYDEDIIENNK